MFLNSIFYIIVIKHVEKSKIIYAGLLKEKIDIYKSILGEVHNLKIKLNQYDLDMPEFRSEVQKDFEKLIRIYSVNRPFLSDKIIELFQINSSELQDIFG